MKISTILDQIDSGSIALPVFQRGYVWNRDQVRGLMRSLYKRYPVGSLIVWSTKTEHAKVRGDGTLAEGNIDLLLDGQQRITSLYGIVRGKAPAFFDGNALAFTGLYFDIEEETFEFFASLKMKGQARWIDVTGLMKGDIGAFMAQILTSYAGDPKMNTYLGRLTQLAGIKDITLHLEKVTGEDKTIEIVVEIFNEVNKGGTKLSQGDLALAKVCAIWPDARQRMKEILAGWSVADFNFKLDWLLRNVNAVINGEALFSKLADVDALTFQSGLEDTQKACNYILNLIAGRLGLDHDRVLGGRYAIPIMSRYLALRGGRLTDSAEQDRLLYWYIHSFLWGRFSGSTESFLNQDLNLIENDAQDLDRLIHQLQLFRGTLRVRPEDFSGYSTGGRFYPLLYLLTRVCGARDWGNGLALTAHLLGRLSALQVHHIFPKAFLYAHKYAQGQVNAVANFCFLTQHTNLNISDREPEVYFAEIEAKYPGALASQWIPMDRNLWKVENYPLFLEARRQLLADAANTFLDQLLHGQIVPAIAVVNSSTLPQRAPISDPELNELISIADAVERDGYARPEFAFELSEGAEQNAVAELAWPGGVQEGLSNPVALIRNDPAAAQTFQKAGFQIFAEITTLNIYLESITQQEAHLI